MYLLTISVNWPGSSFESKHKKAIKQKPKGERSKKTEHEQLLCLSSQRQAMIQLWHFYLGQLSHGGLLWLDHLLLACNYHYWLQIIHVGHLNYCQSTANWRAKSSTLFFSQNTLWQSDEEAVSPSIFKAITGSSEASIARLEPDKKMLISVSSNLDHVSNIVRRCIITWKSGA